jgi:hypothetical protein
LFIELCSSNSRAFSAAHFIAIGGAVIVGLVDGPARRGLALAGASVITRFLTCETILTANKAQRGLTLCATGTITLQMVLDAKAIKRKPGKGVRDLKFSKYIIHDNGTEESSGFNDVTWSKATIKYINFVNNTLRSSSFEKIIKKVEDLMASTRRLQTVDSMDIDDVDDVQLVDLSDDECKLFT